MIADVGVEMPVTVVHESMECVLGSYPIPGHRGSHRRWCLKYPTPLHVLQSEAEMLGDGASEACGGDWLLKSD